MHPILLTDDSTNGLWLHYVFRSMVIRWFKPIDSSFGYSLKEVYWKDRTFCADRCECLPVADLHRLSSTDLGQVYVKTKHIGGQVRLDLVLYALMR